MTTYLGNKPPTWRSDQRAPGLQDSILAAFETQGAGADGLTTGNLAAMLGIKAESPERAQLNEVLTAMRKGKLLKYEMEPAGIRWRLVQSRGARARNATR